MSNTTTLHPTTSPILCHKPHWQRTISNCTTPSWLSFWIHSPLSNDSSSSTWIPFQQGLAKYSAQLCATRAAWIDFGRNTLFHCRQQISSFWLARSEQEIQRQITWSRWTKRKLGKTVLGSLAKWGQTSWGLSSQFMMLGPTLKRQKRQILCAPSTEWSSMRLMCLVLRDRVGWKFYFPWLMWMASKRYGDQLM